MNGFIPAIVGGGSNPVSGGPQPVPNNPPLPGTQGGKLENGVLSLPMGSAPPKLVVVNGPATETSHEGQMPTGSAPKGY